LRSRRRRSASLASTSRAAPATPPAAHAHRRFASAWATSSEKRTRRCSDPSAGGSSRTSATASAPHPRPSTWIGAARLDRYASSFSRRPARPGPPSAPAPSGLPRCKPQKGFGVADSRRASANGAATRVGTRVGTKRVLAWPRVAARVTPGNASVQALPRGNRDSGQVERPPTEPKVRGSNPLGRAEEGALVSQIPAGLRPLGTAGWERVGTRLAHLRPSVTDAHRPSAPVVWSTVSEPVALSSRRPAR
jgi:hypothetical protein